MRDLRKKETQYYKNYLQGTSVKHLDIGDIDFSQMGLETVSKYPQVARDFDLLKKDIKNAKYMQYEEPHHKKHGTKDNIKGFHRLKNGSKEFLIADTTNGPKYYLSKQTDEVGNRPSRVEPTSSNSIIPNQSSNLKPIFSKTLKIPAFDEWLEELRGKRR